MSRETKIIEIALALKPAKHELRSYHLAFIYKKNKPISISSNTRKTHAFAARNGYPFADQATHAECASIIKSGIKDFRGYTMFVLRVDNNNKLNLSAPCIHCANLIRRCGFDSVYYTNEFGQFVEWEY